MANPRITLSGDKELIRNLLGLGKKAVSINRSAINAAASIILRAEKEGCPVEHGHLKKAMAKKVFNRGMTAAAVIGADAAYVASVTTGQKLQLGATKEESNAIIAAAGEQGGVIRPAKYDHLVEFGHLTPGGKQVPAHPFMRNGWDNSIGAAKNKYESSVAAGIEKAAVGK